ncbi:MAG: protein-L-isoaspartate O-methyltransferase [Azoarcus sp.]|jgi:protein-L-isoaspartate(D-aspartate) O-methyltransferase|nr:protein-L-isoaspartate O-methyltransferase [Azoarcus sp.]
MNIEQARFNMVEQQIRPWNVTRPEVRQLFMTVRREDYVPPEMRALAFADIEIPLPCGQAMLRPPIEGRILEAIGTLKVDSVLEIGTGCGFFAALLAQNANHVHTVDIEPELVRLAHDNFTRNGVDNVTVHEGDASQGWHHNAPYDVIVLSGGLYTLPENLITQLKPNGCLFAFIGEPPVMEARVIHRHDKKPLQRHPLFETVVPMLRHGLHPSDFRF